MLHLGEVMDGAHARRAPEAVGSRIDRGDRRSLTARMGLRAAALALASLALLLLAAPALAQDKQTDTVFVQGQKQYPAHILHERVALILSTKLVADKVRYKTLLDSVGGKRISMLPPFVVEVAAPGREKVATLKAYARNLAGARPGEVVDTGLLMTMGQSSRLFVLTDKIIVQIDKTDKPDLINTIAADSHTVVVGGNPFDARQFVVSLQPGDQRNALEVSNEINRHAGVRYALPNFYAPIDRRQASVIPDDTFFADQWHLDNTGQSGGTVDADIDANLAWSFGLGNPDIVIAIIDDGFEIDHPDLVDNVWTNTGEIPGNNIDDDGNGYVDDVHGYDFSGCSGALPCGGGNVQPFSFDDNHGTAVAGTAVARSNNSIGVSGVCPRCKFMPLRVIGPVYAYGVAIDYARSMGADVISNSWGFSLGTPMLDNVVNAANDAAANGRGGLGSVVLFAMPNQNVDSCAGTYPDISSLPSVIAVSRSTNEDRFDPGGFGACMDVVAPTAGGTLSGVTTDRQGANGYNTDEPFSDCTELASNQDYTFCFQGTSFATPVVAGVAGLILSQDNTLTRVQVQHLLQDTADKISDSTGAYSETTGFSAPPSGAAPMLGYGRINAFEAVRTVASAALGGRGGVDIYLRDNRLDWGNTEQPSNVTFEATRGFIPHWNSVDIKIDAPPFSATPPTTSAEFDDFQDENPLSGVMNRIYVRVHNRGTRTATNVQVKLNWAFAGAGLPALPANFWSAFPADPADVSTWHPLPVQTLESLPYSGASVAGGPADGSAVLTFDFNAPTFDPTLANPNHYCLFVVATSAEDPVSQTSTQSLVPDFITPRDNNVTQRNIHLLDSGQPSSLDDQLIVSNPFEYAVETRLVAKLPRKWKLTIAGNEPGKAFKLAAHKSVSVKISIVPGSDRPATIDVVQFYRGPNMKTEKPLGGMTYDVAVRKSPALANIAKLVSAHMSLVAEYHKTLEVLSKKALSTGENGMLERVGKLLDEEGRLLGNVDERSKQ